MLSSSPLLDICAALLALCAPLQEPERERRGPVDARPDSPLDSSVDPDDPDRDPDHGGDGGDTGTRPNILVLLADDIGVELLSAWGVGDDLPPTPNLDDLAKRSLLFRNAWATPQCSPTRAALHTGRHGIRTGVGTVVDLAADGLDPSELTLPEVLAPHYATAAFGKWHLGQDPDSPGRAGYGHFAGTQANVHDYYVWDKLVNGVSSPSNTYVTTDQVDETLAFVATAPEPWFSYVAFHAAHKPLQVPPAELHTQDLDGLALDERRPLLKAVIEALDTEIGRLLNSIDPQVLDRTVVVFLTDNGTNANVIGAPYTARQAKSTVYQGGVHVPLMIAGPGVGKPGGESSALVHVVDLFSTLIELGGVAGDPRLAKVAVDGRSFAAHLADPSSAPPRTHLYTEVFRPNGAANGLSRSLPEGGLPGYLQPDAGYQGPGSIELEIEGWLASGNSADLSISGAPPATAGVLYGAAQLMPQSLGAGLLAPWVPVPFPILSDSEGRVHAPGFLEAGYVAGFTLFYQAVFPDPSLPGEMALSNCVAAEVLGYSWKAVRNGRYKLIRSVNWGPIEMYDLEFDPFERHNILARPVGPRELAAFYELWSEMNRVIDSAR